MFPIPIAPQRYTDMLELPRPISPQHLPMPIASRAAQFAPFAALTGYDAVVQEAARLTDLRSELDNNTTDTLNLKLQYILANLSAHPEITITYFQPDLKKSGGAYVCVTGCVKKIDPYEHTLILTDQTIVPIEQIFALEGSLFDPIL